MKTNSIAIILIIATGSIVSIAYATSTVISDSGIITPSLTITNPGSCSGCGSPSPTIINYTGDGTSHRWIAHGQTTLPTRIIVYQTDSADNGTSHYGLTMITVTSNYVTATSGNDNYAPWFWINHNIVNSTKIDVGEIFTLVNNGGGNYEMNANTKHYQMITR